MHCTAIIPARFNSTRLPGKPLASIGEKAMIEHVYSQTCKAHLIHDVAIATDDERIIAHCTNADIPVFMTSKDHKNGTSRVIELSKRLETDIVINVQGDEPFIEPHVLDNLVESVIDDNQIATIVCPILKKQEWNNPNIVKVVINHEGSALYFSRSPIPYHRDLDFTRAWRHLGVYAFRKDVLMKLEKLSKSTLAETELLEQLAWLEHGFSIGTIKVNEAWLSVDTGEDLVEANRIWRSLNGG